MIRVLQIGLSRNRGGIENCILNYFRYIDKSAFMFDFADIYGAGLSFNEEIMDLGGKIYRLPDYKKHPYRFCVELKELLKKKEFDIIHINVLSAANILPVIISLKYSKVPIIVHSHNADVPSGFLRKFLHSVNIRFLRKMNVEKWACGVKAGRWLWGEDFLCENVITNAVSPSRFIYDVNVRRKVRKLCEFCDTDIVLGFVGRLTEQKNPLFLAEILSALRKKSKRYKMLIVGEGDLQSELQLYLKKLGLLDAVFFSGVQSAVEPWYQAMDLFLLPSHFEGVPIVSVEAQAAGLMCLVSDNVSNEIDITQLVKHLPIMGDISQWIDEIEKIDLGDRRNAVLPKEYTIEYAIKILENKYRILNSYAEGY